MPLGHCICTIKKTSLCFNHTCLIRMKNSFISKLSFLETLKGIKKKKLVLQGGRRNAFEDYLY